MRMMRLEMRFQSAPVGSRMQVLEVLGEGASANTAQQSITGTVHLHRPSLSVTC